MVISKNKHILWRICLPVFGLIAGAVWIDRSNISWSDWYLYLIGLFLYLFCSYCFTTYFFNKVVNPKNIHKNMFNKFFSLFNTTINNANGFFCFIISPNFFFVNFYKNQLTRRYINTISRNGKSKFRKQLIAELNNNNLLFSLIIFLIIFISQIKPNHNYILISFVVYRTISRSVEIIIAFGKDAITRQNRSNLQKFDRIELAIKSYFEVLINFTTIYFLLFFDSSEKIIDAFFFSLGINTLTDVPFRDFLSDCLLQNNILINKFLIALHVLTILTLVVLALAMYISDAKKKMRD